MTGPVADASGGTRARPHRLLHPGAWWLWGGAVAAAAMRTTNVLLLGLLLAAVAFVVSARRLPAPWGRSFGAFVKLAAGLVLVRMALAVVFGRRLPGTVLVELPAVELPDWAAGVSIGGPVTVELLAEAFASGLRLAAVLVCFGALNALCSPARVLKALPRVLFEAGVVVTVAVAFAPELVATVRRLREARRLRGRPTSGLAGVRGLAVPALTAALERAVALAGAMDARGYGRRSDLTTGARRATTLATGAGLLAVCAGVYGLLDAGAPGALGLPAVAVGGFALAAGLLARGRRLPRTRYRPDVWRAAEWVVSASGLACLAAFVAAGRLDPEALRPAVVPLALPEVPWLAALGIAAALVPAWAAPPPPTLADAVDQRSVAPATTSAGGSVVGPAAVVGSAAVVGLGGARPDGAGADRGEPDREVQPS